LESSDDHNERLRLLFEKDNWSEEDRRWLLEYLERDKTSAMQDLMEDRFREDLKEEGAGSQAQEGEEDRLLALIHEKIGGKKKASAIFSLANWKRLSVAALVLLLAGRSVLFFMDRHAGPSKKTLTAPPVMVAGDRPPGINNAVLTLADGSTISLDSAANGGLASQGGTKVIKLNGQISYTPTDEGGVDAAPLLNTIATARGNQYTLVLSDGTRVWLNAASSIRFPTSFTGKDRKVEITGEAYFEVRSNPNRPFTVVVNGGEVGVLGTNFNVNAYSDESVVRTTLLEGAVVVKRGAALQKLSPGQQAEFAATGNITLHKEVETGLETAWKDGFFWFNNTDIHTLMRQVSRWYDVEVVFDAKVSDDGFSGKVSRNVPLSKLLNVLEQYDIHFKIEGKKITVLP